jgi:hypothetical protein
MKRFGLGLSIVGIAMSFSAMALGQGTAELSTPDLECQVAALITVHDLDLDPDQLSQLQALSKKTADDAPPPASKVDGGPPYRAALQALRDALVTNDDAKIAKAETAVNDLRQKLKIDPVGDLDMSDVARQKALPAIRVLRTSQLAQYISLHCDEIPDALDTIEEALEKCHSIAEADYPAFSDEAANQAAVLAGGIEGKQPNPRIDRVQHLLDSARAMSEDEFQTNLPKLDASAKKIVGGTDPITELRNWMMREMADLLSNPQLSDVLEMRLRTERTPES